MRQKQEIYYQDPESFYNPDQNQQEDSYQKALKKLRLQSFENHSKNKRKAQTKYDIIKMHLQQQYIPNVTLCREEEKKTIEQFLRLGVSSKGQSESLYISGLPGIGKTLCVKQVCNKIIDEQKGRVKYIYINALKLKQPRNIFFNILTQLSESKQKKDPQECLYLLNQYFQRGQNSKHHFIDKYKNLPKILVIDQIDFLKTNNQDVYYNLFEWIHFKASKLIIISISNTMNFPETLSSKLSSRIGDQRVPFKSYSVKQIQTILKERIGDNEIFQSHSILFICKKLAQTSSDIRKCLYILRESICEFQLSQKKNLNTKKQIDIEIVNRVFDRVYGDSFVKHFSDFPRSYKMVLYALAQYFRLESKECSYRQLNHLCGDYFKNINELRPVLCDLKDLGIISINYKPGKRDQRINQNFVNIIQLKEEQIKLKIQIQTIIVAFQKQDLNKLGFKVDLNY